MKNNCKHRRIVREWQIYEGKTLQHCDSCNASRIRASNGTWTRWRVVPGLAPAGPGYVIRGPFTGLVG